VDKFNEIIKDRNDLMYHEFLEFWNQNRMIKINTIDRIKCWHQLGNMRIWKIAEKEKDDDGNDVHLKKPNGDIVWKDVRSEGLFEGAKNTDNIKD
jgi:hypothetical protein